MNFFQYINLFVAILFIIFYYIWRQNRDVLLPNWPFIGMLPGIAHNMSNFHDFLTSVMKQHRGTFQFKGPWFTNISDFIFTSDPMNVQHITSKNFNNYGKGSDFKESFEFFGDGIFNLDSNEWKTERKLLHSLLTRKSFKIFHQQNIQKKLENCLIPFLDDASRDLQIIDLQDTFERITFDIGCAFLFGFDPNYLHKKFNDLSNMDCVTAFSVLEDIVLCRHFTPNFVWKLQKWLQIGPEKNGKVAKENIDQFLYKCVSYCKGDEEKRKLKSTEYVDEGQYSCLIEAIMNEGSVKREMVDKYLIDTAFNLLGAGSGTVSSALSWFFWLISKHPLVEAKIIQEIKDNCVTKDENFITKLGVEEFDKLVYLHGAICEALRLYPPVGYNHKCAIKSDILPNGEHVSSNTKVIFSMYAMGRMEEIWGENCLEFKPERWISDIGQSIHVPSYQFTAFNAGPRSCLGKDMSIIQMKMAAVTMLWKFHIQVVEGQSITPRASIVLRMEHGFKVKLTKRCIS
ncbi:alkane hydroxylase MAH1-like [Cicer arietinum]|uniref:Alkane hydroxylase MAH1-like n=1 Tax=Cicer arietinum TaxID=3827 RepID=A0A1S2Z5K9_CICAR|nr:alkane hydroxylase MAH1-like [Cicer arietinum]